MTLHEIRYMFEHRILPDMFFQYPQAFVGMILDDKTKLYEIINSIFQDANEENPYSKEDFNTETVKIDEDVHMLRIIFPEPLTEPLSYWHYLFFNKDFTKKAYYCLEKGNNFFGEETPFLCAWTADGSHKNYGSCELDNKTAFLKCLKLFSGGKYYKDE